MVEQRPFAAEKVSHFNTLHSLRLPRPLRALGWIIVFAVSITALVLVFTPWVQTVRGEGVVTTRNPQDRVQQINALVSGRISEWFVTDGSTVRAGDPIARILDNDPLLLDRLRSEREAVARQLEAIEQAIATATLNYERRKRLFDQGLGSRLDFENARLQVENLRARKASVQADLNTAEINLSRQSTQLVTAPRDGTIISVNAGDSSTFVNVGQALATFMPADVNLIVELKVPGRDVPLIEVGRKVRLQFEGWPAVQFSGWPSIAVGTFGGVVTFVDPVAGLDGLFRVMVSEDPMDEPWPDKRFTMFGARAHGWVLLETVPAGYELWRRLNTFPPQFPQNNGQSNGQSSGQNGSQSNG